MEKMLIDKLIEKIEKKSGEKCVTITRLINGVVNIGITFEKYKEDTSKPCPLINLSRVERDILNGEADANEAVEGVCQALIEASERPPKVSLSKEKILDTVRFELMSVERNEEELKKRPYILFWDLAAAYRIYFDESSSAAINNELMEALKITPEELKEAAFENMKAEKIKIKNTLELFEEELAQESIPIDKNIHVSVEDLSEALTMYVIYTNKSHNASFLLLPDKFQELAEELESDLYIIPSSVHELLIYATKSPGMNLKKLKEIHREQSEILEEELFLCNHIFKYSRQYNNITIV